jgi:hypothetical protein
VRPAEAGLDFKEKMMTTASPGVAIAALLIALAGGSAALAQDAAADAGAASGAAPGVNPRDNITKTELLFRYDSLDLADHTQSFTFKYDMAFGPRWGGNIEVPMVGFEGFGLSDAGLGDVQARLRYTTQMGDLSVIAGGEVVLPTASEDTLGRGKFQINPTLGVVVPVTQTSFVFMGYKHLFSVAGDDDRPDINESQPRLIAGYTDPAGWWTLGDLKYTRSWEDDSEVLDLELEYGRMVARRVGVWARVGTSFFDSDRDASLLLGVRFIR